MAYTYKDAIKTIYNYLNIDSSKVFQIPDTKGRGIEYDFDGIKTVFFIYPISCKQGNRQNFFDTRDSGAKERTITWEYAKNNKLKYFCFGVNEEQDRYKDYVLSLESDENSISNISFRLSETTGATGTQVNIPNDFKPSGNFKRISTPKGFYISAIHKKYIREYIRFFDNRPYLNIDYQKVQENRQEILLKNSKDSARLLVDNLYNIDKFKRLSKFIKVNGKNINIITNDLGGNYLESIFIRPSSEFYNDASRVFIEKEYELSVDGTIELCRLSNQWVSFEPTDSGTSRLSLKALIRIINANYSDIIKIYEEEGKWYLELMMKEFKLEELPNCFDNNFAHRYIISLIAKPFVILTGNSGTGKTRLAKQIAQYLEKDINGKKNWLIVPVGADWTDNTKMLGFYNPLEERYVSTPILDFVLQASENLSVPHFLILDEMNLSHVERYFSDFLSAMESDVEIPLYKKQVHQEDEDNEEVIPERIRLPKNLFVTGTVNIDETTNMFSPKVLDRSNVVEFKPEKNDVLELMTVTRDNNVIEAADFGIAEGFMALESKIRNDVYNVDKEILEQVRLFLNDIYDELQESGFEFAYRTVKEIRKYFAASWALQKKDFKLTQTMDEQMVQKILPKIYGDRKQIGELLNSLENRCQKGIGRSSEKLNLSLKKIEQMKNKLDKDQYASFI